MEHSKEIICRFGHICTSSCGKDYDCPCQAEHCCAFTDGCEGGEHCDDHYEAPKDREFSPEQAAFIAKQEKQCKDAGCDDNGHNHD